MSAVMLPSIRRLVHSVAVNRSLLVQCGTPTQSSLLTPSSWRRGIASSSARLHDYAADTYEEGLLELYDTGDRRGDALEPGKTVSVTRFMNDILSSGLSQDDPRLKDIFVKLQAESDSGFMSRSAFLSMLSPSMPLIEAALKKKLVIPEFGEFASKVDELYAVCADIQGGKVADYIPELSRVDRNLWGVSFCTINGQRHSVGDASAPFTMQSGSKCFTYGVALEEYGAELIHKYIGKEPSGQSFNSLSLNLDGIPHNPMINAGAIMLSSLLKPQNSITDRTNFVLEKYCEMAGVPNRSIKCDIMTCDSEMETAHRNYALLHYMKDKNLFPENTNLEEVLKLYTRLCSVELECERGAIMAATLANFGECPLTGVKVLNADTVCHTLSLMHSSGMYDYAGEFSFHVGLPAKSGVSGVIFLVVPNVMGVCLYSPPVNRNGNSMKGLEFCRMLVDTFNFHIYDCSMFKSGHADPRRRRRDERQEVELTSVMCAAQAGALSTLQRYRMSGMDLSACNYDGRTPLHVSAAEGHFAVVEMLLECPNVSINCTDRWSRTPLDEAVDFGHHDVASLLRERGGEQGEERGPRKERGETRLKR